MDDLRVALISGNHNSVVDGVALTSNRQVAYLLEQQVSVRVYAPTSRQPALAHAGDLVAVPSIPFAPPYRLALGLPRSIREDLHRFQPTVVHLTTPDLLGVAAMRWARRRGIPVVTTYHTHFASYLAHYGVGALEPIVWALQRRFYRRCQEVYVATESMVDALRSRGVQARYVVQPLGVDLAVFSPEHRSEECRTAWGAAPDEVVILFVGRLVWEKGLQMFMRVIQRLQAREVPHRVVIVGEGPAGAALRKGLPGAHFTGRLTGMPLANAFASADLFFFPSASETFGCVTVEAMASGLPCVVADATGSRDLVRHEVDGFVCPADQDDAFEQAITTLIRDHAMRARMGRTARLRAEAFGWQESHARLLEHLRRVSSATHHRQNIRTMLTIRNLRT